MPRRFHPNFRENEMAEVTIRPKPNGPYLIEGPVDIYDTAGNKIATDDRPKIALCRCGASSNKPFCDGTHSKIGFQAAETINPESAEPADKVPAGLMLRKYLYVSLLIALPGAVIINS